MKKERKDKKKRKINWLEELIDGALELVLELVALGIGSVVSFVLPDWMTERIPRAVFYIVGFSLFVGGIILIGVIGGKAGRRQRRNEAKYGKIEPEHLFGRFDLFFGPDFTKETEKKKRHASVTYTSSENRCVKVALDAGRIDCFIGLSDEKLERLTASGIADTSGDPTRFETEYESASNMRRLAMISELEGELMDFLTT